MSENKILVNQLKMGDTFLENGEGFIVMNQFEQYFPEGTLVMVQAMNLVTKEYQDRIYEVDSEVELVKLDSVFADYQGMEGDEVCLMDVDTKEQILVGKDKMPKGFDETEVGRNFEIIYVNDELIGVVFGDE